MRGPIIEPCGTPHVKEISYKTWWLLEFVLLWNQRLHKPLRFNSEWLPLVDDEEYCLCATGFCTELCSFLSLWAAEHSSTQQSLSLQLRRSAVWHYLQTVEWRTLFLTSENLTLLSPSTLRWTGGTLVLVLDTDDTRRNNPLGSLWRSYRTE